MSHPTSGYPPAPEFAPPGPAMPLASAAPVPQPQNTPEDPESTTQVAREEAADLGRTAAQAGRGVAATAQEQAGHVAQEAQRHAKDLLGEARRQAQEQARLGQERAGEGLRALSDELRHMAQGAHDRGPASDLVEQAAAKVGDLAGWLQRHEPVDLLEAVRGLARRRPGGFLLGAVAAGVLTGRLTRGVVDAHRDTDSGGAPDAGTPTAVPARTPVSPGSPPSSGVAPNPTTVPTGFETPLADAPPPGYVSDVGPAVGTSPAGTDPVLPGTAAPEGPNGSAHVERSDATTVGEYVEELERRSDAHLGRPETGGRL